MQSNYSKQKHKKALKTYYQNKNKENKKKISKIDKLFYRIFLSSLLLLMLSIASRFLNYNKITDINYNINFLNIAKKVDSFFNTNIFNHGDVHVYSQNFYEMVIYEDGINHVSNSSFGGVNSLTDGIVSRIEKNNNLYTIYLQASDGYFYIYKDLESIDCFIYQYIKANDCLGKAIFDDNKYTFDLIIKYKEKNLDYFENATD